MAIDRIVTGVAAGIVGTVVMDVLNHSFSRAGMISKIDMRILGRMSAGWTRGRLRYSNPGELEQVENESLYGYAAHYSIGVVLALTYVTGWDLLIGGPASPVWALIYGVATTVASWFFVYPCLGLGALGLRSPEGIKNAVSSLANHLFFGIGMALAIAIT